MTPRTPTQWAREIMKQRRHKALEHVEYLISTRIDPDFWKEVRNIIIITYDNIDEDSHLIEQYYLDMIPEHKRRLARIMIESWVHYSNFGYKQIYDLIKNAENAEQRIFWKYVRRELSKAIRRQGGYADDLRRSFLAMEVCA
ncbi:MAG: hypothetical protein FWD92_02380 [Methanomassiliicoccaceae archaeon]|nr:hypothetical protein [Methanomassiliicoccaceae archaeon]